MTTTTITRQPREIAFDDIRKGDKVRLEYVEFGIKTTREGVAHERHSDGAWCTREGGYIAGPAVSATITLLHRPAPAEPKGLGAVVRARVTESIVGATIVRTFVRTAARDLSWVDGRGNRWAWSHLHPDSIEVLSEGIEVES